MKRFNLLLICIACFACASKDKYDPSKYYDARSKDSLLTSIIAHIYTTPPYTEKQDRFKPEHKKFYSSLVSKFALEKLFAGDKGKHYFFVIRPGNKSDEMRGVGGYFNVDQNFQLTQFREVFVTPLLSDKEVKEKGYFLFDKMAKDELSEFLKMKSYVQWPNEISEYDTITYEWKLKPEFK
jgi:hypothetical protein